MGTHYAPSQDMGELSTTAEKLVAKIAKNIGKRKKIVLAYRGLSGVAIATAVGLEMHRQGFKNFGMIYVRKSNEISHGRAVEVSGVTAKTQPAAVLFVDDFISSGATRDAVNYTIKRVYKFELTHTLLWDSGSYMLRELKHKKA